MKKIKKEFERLVKRYAESKCNSIMDAAISAARLDAGISRLLMLSLLERRKNDNSKMQS